MTINPLSNDKIPKPKNGRYAIVKTLFPRINVEDVLLLFLIVIIRVFTIAYRPFSGLGILSFDKGFIVIFFSLILGLIYY